MDSVVFQYILIGAVVLAIAYSLFRNLKKTFSKSKKGGGCGTNCGCS